MQTGGTAAQYWIGTAEVKRGSHILLGRRTHNALDTRIHKLLGRGNNILINRMSHMLLSRGRRTQIWHTGINAIRMLQNLRSWASLGLALVERSNSSNNTLGV